MSTGVIKKVAGPLVIASGMRDANMFDVVRVSEQRLIGEIIEMHGDEASIQVYEETSGLGPGEPVESMEVPMSVELGPGLITSIYDGIQRPLDDIMKVSGNNLKRGVEVPSLKRNLKWEFVPTAKVGDEVEAGDVIGTVQETIVVQQKIMVPYGIKGTIKEIKAGEFTVEETVAVVETAEGDKELTLMQKWPVRKGRPYKKKLSPDMPLVTGQRVIDTFFPLAKGGVAAVPGPFGSGKTVIQHQLAKWAEADIVVYIGCGERGNEMTDVLNEFPELKDPKTGQSLMQRTVLIANTSDMPVAAREASVYTAMTMAEFYRAMGLKVLLMADSTSRWAQALREMSNRMEELPGPDAFPMDISAIISNFYGRAGFVHLYNGATGSITFIGTVSPAGGNLKEPVTENTKKVARCFYALEQERADRKRYPAVNPIDSYSKYLEYPEFEDYITERINNQWTGKVNELKTRLLRGKEIAEQINILGDDGVPVEYHVIFWKSELIDFVILQQDAFDEVDSVTPMERQEDIVNMVIDICHTNFKFETFVEVMDYFKKMINICKQMNYSKYKSEQYEDFRKQLATLVAERSVK